MNDNRGPYWVRSLIPIALDGPMHSQDRSLFSLVFDRNGPFSSVRGNRNNASGRTGFHGDERMELRA